MTPNTYGRRPQRRGQVLVEFALCIPLLVMLFACVADFGWAMYLQISLHNAVREGGLLALNETGYSNSQIQARVAQAAHGMTLPAANVVITQSTQTIDGVARTIKQITATHTMNFLVLFVFRPGSSLTLSSMQRVMVVPGLKP